VLAADDAGNRRQVDDRPATIGDRRRDRALDAKEHADRIDRRDPVPGFGAVEILCGATGNAGIVDQRVELVEMPGDGGHDSGPALLPRHIERFEPRRVKSALVKRLEGCRHPLSSWRRLTCAHFRPAPLEGPGDRVQHTPLRRWVGPKVPCRY